MVGDAHKSRLRVRQGQQVVEVGGLVRRPGEMFRYQGGFVTGDGRSEALDMSGVEGLLGANRHANAGNRNRIMAANWLGRRGALASGSHIICLVYRVGPR